MSAHIMTPIREEEAEHTMSANTFGPDLKEEADVNLNLAVKAAPELKQEADVKINMAVNATASVGEEEVVTSSSASTVVPNQEEVVNSSSASTVVPNQEEVVNSSSASTITPEHEEADLSNDTIVIGYFFQVPYVKWHPGLEMMSKAGLTQGQYERKVLEQGFDIPEEEDETISIDCPDMPWGVSRTFMVQRSALLRSPALAEFFGSLDYLPGCKMSLHFMNDPGACFEVVKTYLESGPDCYPMLRLKLYINRLTTSADRFMVLIRLHKFAIKLKLIHLKVMAFEVMHDLEWEMSAECCPKIAQLVFAHQSPYDNIIKLWTLKHIGHFYKKLRRSNTWAALVPILDPELGQHWDSMDVSGVRVLSMIAEEATDEAVSDALARFSTPAKNSAVSAVEGPPISTSPTKSEASNRTDASSLTEVPNNPKPSSSREPEVEKTSNNTPEGKKKHKRSKATVTNNHFIIGVHKESVVTRTPTKRSKTSPTSIKATSPSASKPETNAVVSHAQKLEASQPIITVTQYEGDTSGEQYNEYSRKQQEQDDNEWEDEEEEIAIQEAIRSFGAIARDDSKAREVLGMTERSASIDSIPRPRDENAKARRVLGINDDGGGFIAGRKETRMMKVKKSLTRFNYFLNP